MKSLINIVHPTLYFIVEALLNAKLSTRTVMITTLHLAAYMRIWDSPIAYVHRINIYDNAILPDVIFTIDQTFNMVYENPSMDFVDRGIPYFTKYKEYEDANGISRFIDLVVFTTGLEYEIGYELQAQIEQCINTIGSDDCDDYFDSMQTLILHQYNSQDNTILTSTLINMLYNLFYQDRLQRFIYKDVNTEKECVNLATNIGMLVSDYLLEVQ